MAGFVTVGHHPAVTAVRAMLAGRTPNAVLLAGPPNVGKTTLADDLAAGLLCTATDPGDRPCGDCRACRLVRHGNHPDLHRVAPTGPGGQIVIGGKDVRGVRDLIRDLALLPVEGGRRVAIIEAAHRMNDDAQSALLKTLEEPPSGTTIVLCADDEERLLPTIRSRCATIRLSSVPVSDIERLLERLGAADAPTAARLARISGGRPGLALAYARDPASEAIRAELIRSLLDLGPARPAARLTTGRALLGRAAALVGALAAPDAPSLATPTRRKGRGAAAGPVGADEAAASAGATGDGEAATSADPPGSDDGPVRTPAAERRRALALLVELWRDLARDLVLVAGGERGSIRDIALLEELERIAGELPLATLVEATERLVRAAELADANVSPELLLDVLVLRWPATRRAA